MLLSKYFGVKFHLAFAFLLRVILILYGNYHDEYFQVPYTDIDYKVFTDAARHVLNNDSPYKRNTYRYSPIISWLMVINLLIGMSFGKLFFSVVDIFTGALIKSIIQKCMMIPEQNKKLKNVEYFSNLGMMLWIYNPMTMAIATRGNSDSIAGFLVLLTLYLLQLKNSYFFAGLVYGLAIHIRLYPIIYGLTFFLCLSNYCAHNSIKTVQKTKSKQTINLYHLVPNMNQLKLISGCIISLFSLTLLFYVLYGYEFLYESYIYHFIRKDTRHNFSLYFYLQYLTMEVNIGLWQKVLTTLPQLILMVVISFKYGLHKSSLNFAILLVTCVFVTYNSVITSQYFIWILAILPLCLWQIKMTKKTIILLSLLWITSQALWLFSAYLLEFHGLNVFIYIWLQSVSFFCANIACIGKIIDSFSFSTKVKTL